MEISINQHSMKLLALQQMHIPAKHWWLFVLNLTPIRAWSSALPEGMNVLRSHPSPSRNTVTSQELLEDIVQSLTLNSLIAWMLALPRALKPINSQTSLHIYIQQNRGNNNRGKKYSIAVLLLRISRARKPAAELRGVKKSKKKRWQWCREAWIIGVKIPFMSERQTGLIFHEYPKRNRVSFYFSYGKEVILPCYSFSGVKGKESFSYLHQDIFPGWECRREVEVYNNVHHTLSLPVSWAISKLLPGLYSHWWRPPYSIYIPSHSALSLQSNCKLLWWKQTLVVGTGSTFTSDPAPFSWEQPPTR